MDSRDLFGKNVIIGQVSYQSIKVFHLLKKDGIDVKMFFDRNYALAHKKYANTPIFPWSHFYDAYVILTGNKLYKELESLLIESCGYDKSKIIHYEDIQFSSSEKDIMDDFDWEWIELNTSDASNSYIKHRQKVFDELFGEGETFSPLLAVDVNNRCTLNCEYCYTQMPYYKASEKKDYDMDEVIENLKVFLDKVDYIPYLWILGGEPLLHPDLSKLIRFINEDACQKKIVYADILTNGTLLLGDDSINELKNNSLFWRISVSPYAKYSVKQYELFTQLNDRGIPYYSRYMVYWQKFGQITDPSSLKESQIKEKCDNCICRNIHITDGKIYRCPVVAHFVKLQKVPKDSMDWINCKDSYTRKDLIDFCNSISPAMSYCNGNHECYTNENDLNDFAGNIVKVAEQAKGVINYKRYDY